MPQLKMVSRCRYVCLTADEAIMTSWGEIPLLITKGGSLAGFAVLAHGQARIGLSSQQVNVGDRKAPSRRRTRRGKRKSGRRARRASRGVDHPAPSAPVSGGSHPPPPKQPAYMTRKGRRLLRQLIHRESLLEKVIDLRARVASKRPCLGHRPGMFNHSCKERVDAWAHGLALVEKRLARMRSAAAKEPGPPTVMSEIRGGTRVGAVPGERVPVPSRAAMRAWATGTPLEQGHRAVTSQVAPPVALCVPSTHLLAQRRRGGRAVHYWRCNECGVYGETRVMPARCGACGGRISEGMT
jgi:hypothetical protein